MVEDKPKKERSPSFPFISLAKAVARASALHEKHKREPTRLSGAAPTWGYGAKSSGLLQTVAALKQFGLIEDFGSGEDRKIQLSDLARRILNDERPGAKQAALREAAVRPRLIDEYVERWVPDRPSDSHCISELQFDRGFSSDAAKVFLKVFDETVAYSGLERGDGRNSVPELDGGLEAEVGRDVDHAGGEVKSTDAVPNPPPATADPYYFSYKPSVGFEGGFRLNSLADFEGLINMLNGFKILYMKAEDILQPSDEQTPRRG